MLHFNSKGCFCSGIVALEMAWYNLYYTLDITSQILFYLQEM